MRTAEAGRVLKFFSVGRIRRGETNVILDGIHPEFVAVGFEVEVVERIGCPFEDTAHLRIEVHVGRVLVLGGDGLNQFVRCLNGFRAFVRLVSCREDALQINLRVGAFASDDVHRLRDVVGDGLFRAVSSQVVRTDFDKHLSRLEAHPTFNVGKHFITIAAGVSAVDDAWVVAKSFGPHVHVGDGVAGKDNGVLRQFHHLPRVVAMQSESIISMRHLQQGKQHDCSEE